MERKRKKKGNDEGRVMNVSAGRTVRKFFHFTHRRAVAKLSVTLLLLLSPQRRRGESVEKCGGVGRGRPSLILEQKKKRLTFFEYIRAASLLRWTFSFLALRRHAIMTTWCVRGGERGGARGGWEVERGGGRRGGEGEAADDNPTPSGKMG
jgi:hypothetical protein